MTTPNIVLARYLGRKAGFDVLSDERFRPPKWLVNSVTPVEEGGAGDMPIEALNVWKYTVTKLDQHFSYPAALQYWRNKCNKMGYTVPAKYMEGGGGEGASGPWRVKTGDQIEEWVKATLRSKGLLAEVGQTVHDWQMEINSIERHLEEAQGKVDMHLAGIAEGNRVKQRQGWLEKAKKDFDKYQSEMDRAQKEMAKLLETVERYHEHTAPTLAFEQQFQFMMELMLKEFKKEQVVASVQKALDRFEQGLEIEGLEKTAGLMDAISGALSKAWDFVKSAWANFMGWLDGVQDNTKELDKLLDSAGA